MRSVILTISNEDYETLKQSGCRLRGSIGLEGPDKANFVAYARNTTRQRPRKVQQLPHGRTEIYGDRVRLTLNVHGAPCDFAADAIYSEAISASLFVTQNGYTSFGYEA